MWHVTEIHDQTSVRISSANWLYLNTLTSRWAESDVRGVVFVPGWVHHEQISLHLFLVSALLIILRVCSPICSFCAVIYTALLRRKIATHQTPSNRAVHRFFSDDLWSLPRTFTDSHGGWPRLFARRPDPSDAVLAKHLGHPHHKEACCWGNGPLRSHDGSSWKGGQAFWSQICARRRNRSFFLKWKFCRLCLVLCKGNEFWHGINIVYKSKAHFITVHSRRDVTVNVKGKIISLIYCQDSRFRCSHIYIFTVLNSPFKNQIIYLWKQ